MNRAAQHALGENVKKAHHFLQESRVPFILLNVMHTEAILLTWLAGLCYFLWNAGDIDANLCTPEHRYTMTRVWLYSTCEK